MSLTSTPNDLRWLIGQLWPDRDIADPGTWSPRTEDGDEAYAVVPSMRHPTMVLPWGEARVARQALLNFNAIRSTRARVAFRVAAEAVPWAGRAGVLNGFALPSRQLPVSSTPLREHLSEAMGVPDLLLAALVPGADPNRKPTLHLLNRDGRPLGYAKLGWNDATAALVRREAQTIPMAAEATRGLLRVPRVMAAGEWGSIPYTVVEPLPASASRVPAKTDLDDVAMAMARRSSDDAKAWGGSTFSNSLHERAIGMAEDPASEGTGEVVLGLITRLTEQASDLAVATGLSHGDWAPWNMAWDQSELWVWDWEYARLDVPAGLDVLHCAFQREVIRPHATADSLAGVVDRAAHGALHARGIPTDVCALLADVYLIDRCVRQYELRVGTGAWDTRLHPAAARVLDRRRR